MPTDARGPRAMPATPIDMGRMIRPRALQPHGRRCRSERKEQDRQPFSDNRFPVTQKPEQQRETNHQQCELRHTLRDSRELENIQRT